MRLLRVNRLTSGYGDINILKGVSIHVDKGEVVAIIGPNGAGKSTLLKTIFGLLKPRKGKVLFKAKDISGFKPDHIVRLGMGYVPQRENIFPSLTVRENLEMGAYIMDDKIEKAESLSSIYNLLPVLLDRSKEKARNLSGGEQQMLAIGRALMLKPELLLLDEPSAGLAPNLVDNVFDKINDIRLGGIGVVIVEQNARKALGICNRGYVLDMGKNRFEGKGVELLENKEIGKLYLGG